MSEARTTMTVRAVLFDMDGTLVDSTAVVEQVWGEFARRHGNDPAELLAYAHGRRATETMAVFGSPGIDIDAEADALIAREIALAPGVAEVPGAAAFVASLPAESIALVTSAPGPLAAARLSAVGIPTLSVVVAAEDVTIGKPDPQGYLAAATRLGVRPEDAVVFEDADAGLRAGLAAGMRVVVVGAYEGDVTSGLPRIRDYRAAAVERAADGTLTITL